MMLPATVRIHAARLPCDFRKQMDGLAGLVRHGLGQDPQCGDLFLFRNRRGDMVKILFFDPQGFCLFVKRLDRGVFRWDTPEDKTHYELTSAQLGELLRGVPIYVKSDIGA
jgi:transposase